MGEWIRYKVPNPCAPHMCVAFGHHVEWFGVCVVLWLLWLCCCMTLCWMHENYCLCIIIFVVVLCICVGHTQNVVVIATALFMMRRKKWILVVCVEDA